MELHSQTEARVLLLAVDPDMRRIGIGTALMNDVMKLCRDQGMMSIRLEVQTQNTDAIVFYRKLGFVIISTMKKILYGSLRCICNVAPALIVFNRYQCFATREDICSTVFL